MLDRKNEWKRLVKQRARPEKGPFCVIFLELGSSKFSQTGRTGGSEAGFVIYFVPNLNRFLYYVRAA